MLVCNGECEVAELTLLPSTICTWRITSNVTFQDPADNPRVGDCVSFRIATRPAEVRAGQTAGTSASRHAGASVLGSRGCFS